MTSPPFANVRFFSFFRLSLHGLLEISGALNFSANRAKYVLNFTGAAVAGSKRDKLMLINTLHASFPGAK